MRWIKHMTRTWEDEKIAMLIEHGGIEAYGFYWRMVEIVAAKVEDGLPPDCRHSAKTWARLCNLLANRWQRLAQLSVKCGLFTVETSEGLCKVSIPTILKYRDEYSKKSDRVTAKCPDKLRTNSGQTPEQEQKQKQNQIQIQNQKQSVEMPPPPSLDHRRILNALDRPTDFLSSEEISIAQDLIRDGCTLEDISKAYQTTVTRGKPKTSLKYLRNLVREVAKARADEERRTREIAEWVAEKEAESQGVQQITGHGVQQIAEAEVVP